MNDRVNDSVGQARLDEAMRRLAENSAKVDPPPGIERPLLAEFDRVRRRRRIVSWTAPVGVVAAVVAVVVFIGRHQQPSAPPVEVPAAAVESEQPFIPIPYVAPLEPYERAEIVRMELPVAALAAAGLPLRMADVGARVHADVLVGQDGRARAVRLVSVSN